MPERDGWKLYRVGDTGHVHAGRQRSPHFTAGQCRKYLRVANVFEGRIDVSDVAEMKFTDGEYDKYRLLPGDILLNEGQSLDLVGRPAMYRGIPEECCFQNTLVRYRPGPLADGEFALFLFRFCLHTGVFASIAKRTNSIAHLGVARFCDLRLWFPPLAEQRRIVEVLHTWDKAIQHIQSLVDQKERELAALAASLLTGHRRFCDSSGAWARRLLGDVTREVGKRNGDRYGRERVKAVNKMEGMIPMKDHVIAGDLSRYRIVPPRGFAYNPMRLNIGSIAMNEHGDKVLVSPDYVVFEALPGQLDPDFLNHFRRTSRWQRFMEIAGSGSVRVRIYYDNLAQMPLPLPPVDEQRRIAAFLNLARREIDLRRAELAALEIQKHGLMQKLLTGEWRVPVHEETEGMAAEVAEQEVA